MANYNLTQTGAEVQRILDSVQTIDTAPATNSQHPISSGAVKTIENNLTDADTRLLFAERSFGKYNGTGSVTLSQAQSGKYVNTSGIVTSASGYGISNEVSLNAGDILLVPSASAVPASVSVVARIVTRSYDKVIVYTYTYRSDYPELPLTATADYDNSIVYTAQYDETGDTPTLTGWVRGATAYNELPATHEVTESYYEPLVKQSVSAMPGTGYYVYLCPSSMTVVISGYTATVNGGVALKVGWGIFKNIVTNFVGAPGQSVIAQAFADLLGEINGVKAALSQMGDIHADSIDTAELPRVCGGAFCVTGEGAPTAVPRFVGQEYLDMTNKKVYKAFAVTASTGDWTLIN